MFSFALQGRDARARAGLVETPHGAIETPAFMPVGTAGAVKALTLRDLEDLKPSILLANTYHLMLRPGDRLIADLGGLHAFTGWRGPFLTDSGGYQVLSLSALRTLSDEGAAFKSHLDGSSHLLTPERAVEVQMNLGADIIMPLDECPPSDAPIAALRGAVERTRRWAERSLRALTRSDQRMFGIVQGGTDPELREESARGLLELDFWGYAIGGLAVGEPASERDRVLCRLDPLLPEGRPRYLMGVGTPEDILNAVHAGVDLFDCVLPTRNGRNGQLFTSAGRLSIRNARFRDDPRPPDAECSCFTCRTASRAYLRHLHQTGEITGAVLMTIHNLAFYLDTLKKIRETIRSGQFEIFRKEMLRKLTASDAESPSSSEP
jgi:queuine tRNA-ribosyltransferase